MSAPGAHDRAILDVLEHVIGTSEIDDFARALLVGLHRVVPSDWVSLNGIGPEPDDIWAITNPRTPEELFPEFQRLAFQNPLIARLQRTQDGRAYRWSDEVSLEELHALEIHSAVYTHMDLDYQIAFTLPAERDHFLGVALSRKHVDFTDDERDLLNEARPFLIQAYRSVVAFDRIQRRMRPAVVPLDAEARELLGLTPREGEVLSAVIAGRSNQEAADDLGLSVRTVQKHLERAFRKLGVRSRTEAAARLLAGPPDPPKRPPVTT